MSWIEQLEQARITLLRLRLSIRGNSASQVKMAEKLSQVIELLDTQIRIEEAILK